MGAPTINTTNTTITPTAPTIDPFDLDKFHFILHDEQTYHNHDDSMAETEIPAAEIPKIDMEEISQPSVSVPVSNYQVFVPEGNISITVPVSQTIPVTDSFSLDMKVMAKNTGLKTRMKARPNNEKCKAYRERKKIEKELMMKEFEEETRRNEELKLILKHKEEELHAFRQKLFLKPNGF